MEENTSPAQIPSPKRNFILIIAVVGVVLVSFIAWMLLGNKQGEKTSQIARNISPSQSQQNSPGGANFTFVNPKKSAHYESNTPAHGVVLEAPPINVVIDFNFDLAKPSQISINKDGQNNSVGATIIDSNKLAMRRNFDLNGFDGLYTVTYNACWPDGSCHDGSFQFAIDRQNAEKAVDLRGKSEVMIDLADIAFNPKDVRVNRGTKITWTNSDSVAHYINTDSHPAHTYYPEQNSKALGKSDTYTLTFSELGAYPYHCSAHTDTMSGRIIVE